MNAVNLIPADRRKRSVSVPVSPLTLGVIGGLVVVLIAAVLYAFALNDVRSRKSELSRVTANAASWQAAASSYASYVTAAQQQKQQLTDIRQLVTGRFPWSLLLSQIGGVMPDDAALSSLQATSPSAASAASAATTAATAAPTPTTQPIAVAGCAASESAVAATMVALGRVQGVASVQLASTTDSGATSSKTAASSTSGGCPFPVTFSLSLLLASPSSGTTTASAATTPTSTSTTPAATPAASTATTPATGSAQ
jgi:Tfp pilus assembly protein PilN